MPPILRQSLFACMLVALVGGTPAAAGTMQVGEIEQAPASVGFDLIILRPLGLLATGVGVALAVPATALTALTHPQDVHKPIDFLVMRPARYTFADPIGTH
jgi:hypothetical protein